MADTSSLYRTPDDYLLTMIQRVQQSGSAITDFSIGSGARTLLEAYAATASQHSAVLEQLRQDSYLATATSDALDAKAADYQVERKAAVAATGTIRINRPAAGAAVTIPAGWGNLLTTPVPGAQPIAVITTEDASFSLADTTIDVAAAAVEGGSSGNIAAGTVLLPTNPVGGFDTASGFTVLTAFTGGVDAETDDQLRARVPIEVQGRIKGTSAALLAATLKVPGVVSAAVVEAGDTRDAPLSGTVPAGEADIYFQGDSSLLGDVQTSLSAARVVGQSITAAVATGTRLIVGIHVFCLAGVDTVALTAAVVQAAIDVVSAVGVDQTVYASELAKAIHDVPDVISVALPFTDLRKSTQTSGTTGDVVCGNNAHPTLAAADVAVTVTTL